MPMLAGILSGFAFFLAVAYVIRARQLTTSETRLRDLAVARDVVVERGEQGTTLLRREASTIPALGRLLNTNSYATRWAFELERAHVKLRVGEYFLMRGIFALLPVMLAALLLNGAAAFFVAMITGLVGFMLPAYWLRMRTSRRKQKIESQLVETFTLIANGLRSGFAFSQSIAVTAQRMDDPISSELNRMLLDISLGASTEDALTALNERVGSDDVDMVVTAILIQRNTGGNLAEVIESVTETIRDRERIQGEIKTMTSQQRLTGWVLSLWPATLGLIFFAVNRSMMSLMWTTSEGLVLLVIWIVLNILGILTIRRILAIDI